MLVPEIFKYFSLFSLPVFLVIAIFLIKKIPDFSFKKHTISKTALFLKDPHQMFIFRLNFVVKALFDLCFIWYLINRFNLIISSPLFWLLISTPFLFSLLAYYIVGKHTVIHKIIVYGYGIIWAICQVILARNTGDFLFIKFTNIISFIALILAFGFLFIKKKNFFVQAVCIFLLYVWLTLYVFRYL